MIAMSNAWKYSDTRTGDRKTKAMDVTLTIRGLLVLISRLPLVLKIDNR